MSQKFDYTATAQRFSARFPLFTHILTQTNFWIIGNVLLGVIIHLHALSIGETLKLEASSKFGPILIIAIILGGLYGVSLGLTDYFLDKAVFRKQSLGKVIVLKTMISLSILALLLALLRYVLFGLLNPIAYNVGIAPSKKSWEYLFYILAVFYLFIIIVINFINQVNKKYGPGVLLPLLLGKYRHPQEEERIFLFMDLKSSTSAAEKLGHLKYSSFIRDCFMDINHVLLTFNASVYQYVGDEIVVTWTVADGLRNQSCVKFFFACERQFIDKSQYYTTHYDFLPHFKAGLHMGKVTAVEIGDIKRDIAYHGDTLNTAARIQGVCNRYNKRFLVSQTVFDKIGSMEKVSADPLGMIQLKGKTASIGIVSIEDLG